LKHGVSTRALGLVLGIVALAGCGKEPTPVPGAGTQSAPPPGRQSMPPAGSQGMPPAGAQGMPGGMQSLPEGHPSIGAPSSSGPRALKPTGIGSEAELDKVAAPLKDPAVRARFEDGFRRCFTSDQASRDYMGAATAMNEILEKVPNFAPAYRVLAYAKLNTGDMQASTDLYRKAVDLDPNYGEAQYALAFMLTQMDPVEGRKHFEKAMQLGVPDERDLRTKFYPPGS